MELLGEPTQALASAPHADTFAVALAAVPEPITVVEADGRFSFANRAAAELLGFSSAEELCATPPQRVLDRFELLDEAGQRIGPEKLPSRAAMAGGHPRPEVVRFRRKDTLEDHWSIVSAAPVFDGRGAVVRVVNVFRDITEQKKREARLRLLAEASRVLASSLEYEATVGAVASLIVPTLAAGCVIDVDENGGELRRHAAVFTQTWTDHPPPDAAALEAFCVLAVPLSARGRTLGSVMLLQRSSSAALGDEDVALAEELASRLALAIDNARLYRGREDMLGVVSHDLRNPLNLVLLATGGLSKLGGGHDPAAARFIQRIERAVAQMTRLVDDLLDVTRMEAGRLTLKIAAVDVDELVREAIERVSPIGSERGIEIEARVEDRLVAAADRERALQILANLLGNAVKFSPDGARVVLSVARSLEGICFRVIDAGPGLRRADSERIFERFWRGRESREGAGLGLAIAKAIVLAHGGRIWAESRLGFGSTFVFTLPEALRQPET